MLLKMEYCSFIVGKKCRERLQLNLWPKSEVLPRALPHPHSLDLGTVYWRKSLGLLSRSEQLRWKMLLSPSSGWERGLELQSSLWRQIWTRRSCAYHLGAGAEQKHPCRGRWIRRRQEGKAKSHTSTSFSQLHGSNKGLLHCWLEVCERKTKSGKPSSQ